MSSFRHLEQVHCFLCSMSSSNCCFLTCIQVSQEAVKVIWYSHFFKNFPQFVVIHTVKGFGIVNEAELDVFLEFSCFFYDPRNVGKLISGSSAFFKYSLNIWKLLVHVLLKPNLENFKHYFANVWDECNCVVVWTFSGTAFLWDWSGMQLRNTVQRKMMLKIAEWGLQKNHNCSFFFWLWKASYVISVPWTRIKFMPPALQKQSCNHWSAKEIPTLFFCLKS